MRAHEKNFQSRVTSSRIRSPKVGPRSTSSRRTGVLIDGNEKKKTIYWRREMTYIFFAIVTRDFYKKEL